MGIGSAFIFVDSLRDESKPQEYRYGNELSSKNDDGRKVNKIDTGKHASSEHQSHARSSTFQKRSVLQSEEHAWGKNNIMLVLFCLPWSDDVVAQCAQAEVYKQTLPKDSLVKCSATTSIKRCAEDTGG